MDSQTRDDCCDEPDADFFDTFFDDGVLETIGEVLGDARGSSSREEKSSYHKLQKDPTDKATVEQDQQTVGNISTSLGHVLHKTGRSFSHEKNESDSIKELLAKVKTSLTKASSCKLDMNSSDISSSSYNLNSCNKEKEKNDLKSMVRELLQNPSAVGVDVTDDGGQSRELSKGSNQKSNMPTSCLRKDMAAEKIIDVQESHGSPIDKSLTKEKEDGELESLKESSSNLNSSSSSSLEKTPPKDILSTCSSKMSKDDMEKENDLVSDEVCPRKIDIQPSLKKKKIPINLKTQILSSTTIFNSKSTSTPNLQSPDLNKCEPKSSKTPNPSSNDVKNPKDKRYLKKRDRSRNRESSHPESESFPHKSQEKESKKRKKNKREDSPPKQYRMRKKSSKQKRERQCRSKSRSSSPRYLPKRKKRHSKSPDYLKRRKHYPSMSRSSSKSPTQRYECRFYRSPKRRRSRSRSPFINEIKRLKKQWEREDEEKRNLALLSQTSTTIVSNMVSVVSVESVQVHRASFSSGNHGEVSQGYPAHSPLQGVFMGPHLPSAYGSQFSQPDYLRCDVRNTYPNPPLSEFPVQPEVPGYSNLDSIAPVPALPSNVSGISSLPVLYAPLDARSSQSEPPSSVLRKQLDILKSTVVGESVSNSSAASPRRCDQRTVVVPQTVRTSLVQIDCASKSLETNKDTCTQIFSHSLVPNDCEAISSADSQASSQSPVQRYCEPISSDDFDIPVSDPVPCKPISCAKSETAHLPPQIDRPFKNSMVPTKPSQQLITDNKALDSLSPVSNSSAKSSASAFVSPTEPSKVAPSEKLNYSGEDTNENVDKTTQSEQYDSDVIIDEVPPKPSPEVIFLSDEEVSSKEEIENSNEPLYDLDEEFNKICNDIEKSSQQDCVSGKDPSRKRKRNRKKRRRDKKILVDKEKDEDEHKATTEEVDKQLELNILGNRDSVLKECREMIDSLRIGRFVVIENEDSSELVSDVNEDIANSPFRNNSRIEFSFSRCLGANLVPELRDISTNTPFRLCLDVSTNTDYVCDLKDAAIQADLNCLGCIEKTDLLKNAVAELVKIREERDELLSVVMDIQKNVPSIPGLDLPETKRESSDCSKDRDELSSSKIISSVRNNGVFDQITSDQFYHSSSSSLSASTATSRHYEDRNQNAVLAYDYNHSSTDEYLGPLIKPF